MKHNKNVRKMHEKVDEVIDNATLNKIEDMYSTYKPTFSEVSEVPEVSGNSALTNITGVQI